jgi:hypothetical protein
MAFSITGESEMDNKWPKKMIDVEDTLDPIIRILLSHLPKTGNVWPEADRKLWLQLLEGSFKLIYKDTQRVPTISIPRSAFEAGYDQGQA